MSPAPLPSSRRTLSVAPPFARSGALSCALTGALSGALVHASLGASLPAQAPLAGRVATALDRARPALLHHLAREEGGELALCCLAACHDGVPRDDPLFAAALERLSRADIDDTYGLSLRLMVLAELPDLQRRAELVPRDAALLAARQTSGGFSYHAHDGWWDLSNTQYAALGLRAAAALGHDVPRTQWKVLYQAVRAMQHDHGGFTYRPGQGRGGAYESMTAAGIAVLQVCAQMLALEPADRERHDHHVERAWQWLGERSASIGERRTHCWLYFLYGLERAAILSDRELVGGVDWYAAGAEALCETQLQGGGWWGNDEFRPPAQRSGKGHCVDTAFAVLFLRRKFQKVQTPLTGRRAPAVGALSDPADDEAVRAAAARDAALGDAALPGLLPLLRSDVAAQRRAAVLAIYAITKQDFGIRPWRAPVADDAAIQRAEVWWQQRRAER